MDGENADVLSGLQEYRPYAQKHPHSEKGYVVGMRRKNARDVVDERETYLHKGDVMAFVVALIAERDENEAAFKVWRRRCEEAEAERDAYRADADRLNWLDSKNIPKSIGWEVSWAPIGNVSVDSVIFLGQPPTPIREAIDAARAGEGEG